MNAKSEFLEFIKDKSNVKCVFIEYGGSIIDNGTPIILKMDYYSDDWTEFVNKLDFEYYDGYGGQELFGTIWFDDGTWADRGEYDGSEWWDYHTCPKIINECYK